MANDELRFKVTATGLDKAIDQTEELAKNVEKVDGETVDLKTKLTGADKVDAFVKTLDKLTDDDKAVVLALKAAGVQGELTDLMVDISKLTGDEKDIDLKIANAAELSSELDGLNGKLDELAANDPGGKVGGSLDKAKGKLTEMRGEADQSRSVLANMVGNASQDLSQLGGVAGTAGQALGQLGEYAADGSLSLSGLGATLPAMLLIGGALQLINKHMEKQAKIKAFNEDQIKGFLKAALETNEALREITGSLADIDKGFTGTEGAKYFDVLVNRSKDLVDQWKEAGKIEFMDTVREQTVDLIPYLDKAKLNAADLAKAVSGDQQAYLQLTNALAGVISNEKERVGVISAVADARQKYTEATRDAAQQDRVFADNAALVGIAAEGAALSTDALTGATAGATEGMGDAATAAQEYADGLVSLYDAQINAADSSLALWDAAEKFNEATAKSIEAQKDHASNSKEVTKAVEDERDAAIGAAKAAQRYADEHAASTGKVLTATQKIDALNSSLIDSAAKATPAARDALISYIAEVNQIPPDKATKIQALIEQGKLDEAKAMLDEASATRTATMAAQADQNSLNRTEGQLDAAAEDRRVLFRAEAVGLAALTGAFTGAIRAAGGTLQTTNNTFNFARGMSAREMESTAKRWARINGH